MSIIETRECSVCKHEDRCSDGKCAACWQAEVVQLRAKNPAYAGSASYLPRAVAGEDWNLSPEEFERLASERGLPPLEFEVSVCDGVASEGVHDFDNCNGQACSHCGQLR